MDNCEKKTDYELLLDELKPFIREKGLDIVSVKSLLLSTVEFDYVEDGAANTVFISSGTLSGGKSIKARNVKISVRLALNIIFAVKTAFSENGCWLILCILDIINNLINDAVEELTQDEAVVLFAIYRLRNADPEMIDRYVAELKENGYLDDKLDVDIRNSLKKLEKIRTIKLENGLYMLDEAVVIK